MRALPLELAGFGAALLIASLLGGCQEDRRPKARAGSPPSPAPARFPLVARGAFDLALTGDGAALFHTAATGTGDELRIVSYAADGQRQGAALVARSTNPGARITEVAASGTAGELGVIWLEESPTGAAAFASIGTPSGPSFAPPVPLGSAAGTQGRGRLAMIARAWKSQDIGSGRFAGFHQTGPEACPDGRVGCSGFVLHQLEPDRATARRVTLSVPAPCARAVAGFAQADDRWYYGVCSHQDGHPTTTFFTIEHSPEYAQAETFLPDCQPLGVTVVDRDVYFTGQCARSRRAVRLGRRDAPAAEVDLSGLDAGCHDGNLILRTTAQPPFKLRLAKPVDHLAPLLPPELAPDGARAVWTGEVLLVAVAGGAEVRVHRYGCHYRQLTAAD